MSEAGEADEGRDSVDELVAVGLLFAPILFVWPLLRKRYSGTLRLGAAIYVVLLGVGIAAHFLR